MDISVVISLFNEDESLPELVSWIKRVMDENKYSYEIILVDDGSTDNSWELIEGLNQEDTRVRGIKFSKNYGKSAALYCGFEAAQGDVVITMDADLQDSPDEIQGLFEMVKNEGYDLVSGWKQKRFDPVFTKNIPSKLFNATARWASGIQLNDFNCGLKAYRKKVIKTVEVYGEMHRYIPVLAKQAGFSKIGEKVVEHRARKYGKSKFGWERFINGFLDLMTLSFMSKFGKRPMHFFGVVGIFSFMIGFSIMLYFSITKIFFHHYQMTARPLFYFAILAIIVGGQLFLTGFMAELIARNSQERNKYSIDKKI